MKLDGMWMGKDEGSTTADFIDIMMKPQPGSEWTITHYLGSADDPNFAGTGWGVRVIQLDSPPEGFDMGGEAWIELTVSSLTATEFAARPTKTPNPATAEGSWIKVAAPTHDDPIAIRAPLDATNVIEELVLVETTDDMTQWIIALANDQVYHHSSLYRGFSGGNALNIRINGGGTS